MGDEEAEDILEDEIPKEEEILEDEEAEDILEDEIPEDEPENEEVQIEKDDAAKEGDSLMKSMETEKLDGLASDAVIGLKQFNKNVWEKDEEADTAEESVQKFYLEKGLLDVPE